MAKPALVIDSLASLGALHADAYRSMVRRRFGSVNVAFNQLSPDDNAMWTRKLSSVYFSCGCNEGKVTGTIGLIGVLFWLFQQPGGFSSLAWSDLVLGAVIVLASAALGKFAALAMARRLLTRWIRALETALESRASLASDAH